MNELLEKAKEMFHLPEQGYLKSSPVLAFEDRLIIGSRACDQLSAELVLWTSVETAEHLIRIEHSSNGYAVTLTSTSCNGGLLIHQESQQEQRQNLRMVRHLEEHQFSASIELEGGQPVLKATAAANSTDEALQLAHELALTLTRKLGMELALANLISVRENVSEVDDHTLANFLPSNSGVARDSIIFSELTQCIRCRNNWPEAIHLTHDYPQIQFGFVFLNKSRAAFKRKVFAEERPDIVPTGIVAPTTFFIKEGHVKQYVGTMLHEQPPSPERIEQALRDVFDLG